LPDDPTLERPDDPNDTAQAEGGAWSWSAVAFAVTPSSPTRSPASTPTLFPVPVDDPPIQPAGWAFAIWGVIYLWLLASAGFGLFKRDIDPDWDAPALAAVREPRHRGVLDTRGADRARSGDDPDLGDADRRLLALRAWRRRATGPWLALPLGLYAGWLTAASRGAGHRRGGLWPGLRHTLSWVGVAIALLLAITFTQNLRVPTYPLAVAWALAGIVAANATDGPAFAGAALGGVLGMLWLMLKILRPKT
jgi:hypothetical protein